MKTYCLFEGRHELPSNSGPLFSAFDFESRKGVRTDNFSSAIQALEDGEEVAVLVTGLTPALAEFIFECPQGAKLTLLHFDANTKQYWPQKWHD
jgi:glutamine amidotransferase-like uncharacterized protein